MYNYYIVGLRRVQNLEAAGPSGSLLRSLDPLVDVEIAAPSSITSNRFQSWSQFLALWSSSADRRARRVMQKSLKALRGTEYCRYVDGIYPGHAEMEKKAQNGVVLRGNVDGSYNVLQGIKSKGEDKRKKQFLHKGKNVLCACITCSLSNI